ncbi:GNAT family N-acetyltransferase [Nocardia fluminea]|uniref:GNAT family N-acetyltransferase n=1 Tax=Nocardia fluminea TaxID=134984 RepID=UPI003650A251
MDTDVDDIAALKAAVEDATYSHYGTAGEHAVSLVEFCSPDYIRKLRSRGTVLVAVDNADRIVGMVAKRSRGHGGIEISGLYCSLGRRGIGTSLLLAALDEMADDDVVTIEVFSSNANARKYFEHLGFLPNGAQRYSESYVGQVLLGMAAPIGRVRHHAKSISRVS